MSQRFQFSLRSLFWLTAVVAVVVGTMSMLGRTHHFRALGSVHAYLALLPIAGVWAAWRTKFLGVNRLITRSLLLYLISLALPLISWDHRLIFGFAAMIVSPFLLLVPWESNDMMWQWFAGLVGVVANCGYLSNILVASKLIEEQPLHRDLQRITWLSFVMSLLVLIPLGLTGNLDTIYIGYGVWVAAMLAMWLGVRGEQAAK